MTSETRQSLALHRPGTEVLLRQADVAFKVVVMQVCIKPNDAVSYEVGWLTKDLIYRECWVQDCMISSVPTEDLRVNWFHELAAKP